MTQRKCGRRLVTTTHESRILFPASGITKSDLIDYYEQCASYMIPHIGDRPLTMHRFPKGIDGKGFYQKDAASYFPSWIHTKRIKKQEGGFVRYVVCNDQATLVFLANQAVITPHVWLSRIDKLQYPDRMIFDLDPSRNDFDAVRSAALRLKELLESFSLQPFVMTTGSRGVHVVVPLRRTMQFDAVRECARYIGELLVARYPDEMTMEIRKQKRAGRIFIDVARNAFGQTGVAPYAVRALEHAPVATPITWDELASGKVEAQTYTIKTVLKRLATQQDPWCNIQEHAISLTSLYRKISS